VNLIRIEGSSELLRSLQGIPDLYLAPASLQLLGNDRAEIWARAETGAIQQLERCAELLGVDLATVREAAANVEPYLRADGTRVWSLMQLERQLRPEAYGRRRGGYVDRRRTRSPMGGIERVAGAVRPL
jgi:hypothetical protein